jgi:hypothetical protein
MTADLSAMLDECYAAFEGNEALHEYARRHGIESQAVLTVIEDELAGAIADLLEPRIAGKTVIEIGGGIGLLAFHLGRHAKRVFCIEANPVWSHTFLSVLIAQKPKNVSYLFGAAEEFADLIHGDVALFCTHSGVESMWRTGNLFAPVVIDVYGELIEQDPEKFDPIARVLRRCA